MHQLQPMSLLELRLNRSAFLLQTVNGAAADYTKWLMSQKVKFMLMYVSFKVVIYAIDQ